MINYMIYLYDHPAGDKEVGEGREDPKRVRITKGKMFHEWFRTDSTMARKGFTND